MAAKRKRNNMKLKRYEEDHAYIIIDHDTDNDDIVAQVLKTGDPVFDAKERQPLSILLTKAPELAEVLKRLYHEVCQLDDDAISEISSDVMDATIDILDMVFK